MPYPAIVFASKPRLVQSTCLLPVELVLLIIQQTTDRSSLSQISLTCSHFARQALERLWSSILITAVADLAHFTPSNNIVHWIRRLDLSLPENDTNPNNNNDAGDHPLILPPLPALHTLSLHRVHRTIHSPPSVTSLDLSNCGIHTTEAVLRHLPAALMRLVLRNCPVSDRHMPLIAEQCHRLVHLVLMGGIFSDDGLVAITAVNPALENVIVVAPRTMIQSNTITHRTIESLAAHCRNLKQFVCPGQSRIAQVATVDYLKANCPALELCDVRHALNPQVPLYVKTVGLRPTQMMRILLYNEFYFFHFRSGNSNPQSPDLGVTRAFWLAPTPITWRRQHGRSKPRSVDV